jgi:hypothetical protein
VRRSKGTLLSSRFLFCFDCNAKSHHTLIIRRLNFSFGHNFPLPLCCAIESVVPFYAVYAVFL